MTDFTICNVCDRPTNLADSTDIAEVRPNTRPHRHEEFTVWRCNHCRSLHCKEMVDLDFYYRDYYLKDQVLDYFTRCSSWNRERLLRKVGVQRNHRILDYGCGKGLVVEYLRQRGYTSVEGYDPFVPEFSTPTKLNEKYDAITMYEVIEHVEDPRDLLGEMAGRVKLGGILAVSTPNAAQIDLSLPDTPELHQPYHRHLLSESALIDMGRPFGLTPAYIYRRFFLDTLFPAVNTRFVWEYVRRHGNVFDVLTEPPRIASVFLSPRLLFFSVAGYFFPTRQSMMVLFRRVGTVGR